jgi:HAMP domain-containing protein
MKRFIVVMLLVAAAIAIVVAMKRRSGTDQEEWESLTDEVSAQIEGA